MTKNEFVTSAIDLASYALKLNESSDILEVELTDGIIGNILDGWGDALILAILPEGTGEGHTDYFFEEFWHIIYDCTTATKLEVFYDEATKGIAPESYLKQYNFI